MKPVVLITGGSRGIGRAAARLFAERGWNVAIGYAVHRSEAAALAEELRSLGAEAGIYRADVRSGEEVDRMAADVIRRFGRIDAGVACAGTADSRLLQDVDEETYENIMETNLGGAFRLCRALLPGMIARKAGSLVLVSSMWGQTGGACEAVYSAAKAGVIGLCRALAKEEGPSGIRVNCVAPGVILTDMTKPLGEETLASLAEDTPLGRNGTAAEVAEAIWYLATEASSFVTGQVLGVNGGLVI